MAPEQLAGERDIEARADFWAIGVVLYECLCGAKPFAGRTAAEILLAATKGPAPSFTTIDDETADLLRALLARDRSARPASAGTIVDALARIDRDG
jgi:serine/threonine-protein kinase